MEKSPDYQATEADPRYPEVRYHPDGRSIRVLNKGQDLLLGNEGWASKPFPPVEPKEIRTLSLIEEQARIDILEERVLAVEKVLAELNGTPEVPKARKPLEPPIKKAS